MDWNDLSFFLAVAETRSLSAAAKKLGVSVSTVSRRISALEGDIGRTLFRHQFNGYHLTDAGENLLAPAGAAHAQLRAFERTARADSNIAGMVRLDLPELLGQQILVPEMNSLIDRYPALRLDICSSVKPVRLESQISDIALRITAPGRGAYKIRCAGKCRFRPYAHRNYLEAHGEPRSDRDWVGHRIIGWNEDLSFLAMATWMNQLSNGTLPTIRFSSYSAQVSAVESGLGIAVLPCFAATHPDITPLSLPGSVLTLDLWLLVRDQSSKLERVQVVKDHIINVTARNLGRLLGED